MGLPLLHVGQIAERRDRAARPSIAADHGPARERDRHERAVAAAHPRLDPGRRLAALERAREQGRGDLLREEAAQRLSVEIADPAAEHLLSRRIRERDLARGVDQHDGAAEVAQDPVGCGHTVAGSHARGARTLDLLARHTPQRREIAIRLHALGRAAPEPRERRRVARGPLEHHERRPTAAQLRHDLLGLAAEPLVDHDEVEVRAPRVTDALGEARHRLHRNRAIQRAGREHSERDRGCEDPRVRFEFRYEDPRARFAGLAPNRITRHVHSRPDPIRSARALLGRGQ